MQVISKIRILTKLGLILILVFLMSCQEKNNPKTRILLITGGHDFDSSEFFGLFADLSKYSIDTLSQPYANSLIGNGKADAYDVLVFYDSWQTISEAEKKAYLDLTERGTGFLFLHHSLVSYQEWEEFTKIRGGRYPKSNPPDSINDGRYRHDIDLLITILDSTSTITKGMNDFTIHDEGYSNVIVNPGIAPLLKTNHPDCAEFVAWTNRYNKSKVVYLMGGHDRVAFGNKDYERLISNSLEYLAEKE